MRKKIFTLFAVALSVLSAQAAEDLVLDASKTVSFSGWGFENGNAPTITISNWASGGWKFETPLSQNDYSGIDFTLEATTVNHFSVCITYAGDATQNIDVPKGSTNVRADFVLEGDIKQIGFSYGDWEGGPAEANITIVKALVVSNSEGEVINLPFADIVAGEECVKNDEDQTLLLTRYASYPCWVFDPAINSDDYEKIVVTFADPIPDDGLEIKAEAEDDEWSGSTITGLTKGATKAIAFLSNKPGVKIKSIGFYYSWNNKTDNQTTLKIANAQLIKKSDTGVDGLKADVANDIIYNLNGQRVSTPAKGIYIKNGKKFIVR